MDAPPRTVAQVPDETARTDNHLLRPITSTRYIGRSCSQVHSSTSISRISVSTSTRFPGTREWRHSSVCQPDISVTMLRSFSLERSFEVPPTVPSSLQENPPETFLNRNFKPSKQLQRIQMIKRRQRAELVQARHNISVFNVRRSADVHDEIGAATHRSEFIARSITVRQRQVAHGLGAIAIRAAWDPPAGGFDCSQRTPEVPFC